MPTEFSIIGAGGHAKVVLDAVFQEDASAVVRLYDDDPGRTGKQLLGVPIRLRGAVVGSPVHIAVGNCQARSRIAAELALRDSEFQTIQHIAANVSSWAHVSPGSFLAAGSVVAASARLGAHVIVNHNAVIDHDCVIEDCVHVAPGAVIAGGCHVGREVLIGAGAVLRPGISVGSNAVIGAGAVVVKDVASDATVAGIPARSLHA